MSVVKVRDVSGLEYPLWPAREGVMRGEGRNQVMFQGDEFILSRGIRNH